MKGIYEFALFLFVLVVWMTWEFVARHSQSVTFTFGLVLIVIGCAFIHISLAFLVPGVIICGLMTLARLIAMRRKAVKDA